MDGVPISEPPRSILVLLHCLAAAIEEYAHLNLSGRIGAWKGDRLEDSIAKDLRELLLQNGVHVPREINSWSEFA